MSDDDETFVKPVMRGKRFEEHSIPLDVLPELPAYQEFVLELAKSLFLSDNPSRQRVPKGFSERLELRLGQIRDNCATPVLERKKVQSELVELPDEFDRARDLINESIEAIARKQPLPDAFPRELLPHFNKLGRYLRDDESIEFVPPGESSGAMYDVRTRKSLVALTKEDYRQTVTIDGTVRASDVDNGRFVLERDDGARIRVSLSRWQEREILDALRFYRSRSVKVTGIGVFSPNDELKQVEQLQKLEVEGKGPDVEARLAELSKLPSGWLEEDEAAPPASSLLQTLREGIPLVVEHENLPNPYIYPTIEGGLRLEWDFGDWEVEAEFDTEGRVAAMAFNLETDEAHDTELSWDPDEQWAPRLSSFVAQFLEFLEG